MHTFCKTCELKEDKNYHLLMSTTKWSYGISRKLTSFASFSANCPGPESIAKRKERSAFQTSSEEFGNLPLIVPEVKACSRFTINSCPSDEISLTYIASGPSQPPYFSSFMMILCILLFFLNKNNEKTKNWII